MHTLYHSVLNFTTSGGDVPTALLAVMEHLWGRAGAVKQSAGGGGHAHRLSRFSD